MFAFFTRTNMSEAKKDRGQVTSDVKGRFLGHLGKLTGHGGVLGVLSRDKCRYIAVIG
jgi:hypothetical protein